MRPPVRCRAACAAPRGVRPWHILLLLSNAGRRSRCAGVREPDAGTRCDECPTRGECEGGGHGDVHPSERTGRHVLAWGAVDAIAPDPNAPQQQFKLDYTGGWGRYRKSDYWRRFKNVCRAYRDRRSSMAWPLAPRRTARTGRFRAGSASSPFEGSRLSVPAKWHGSFTLALRSRSRSSRSRGTGRTRDIAGIVRETTLRGKPVHGFKTPTRGRRTATRGTCTSIPSTPHTVRAGNVMSPI